ncbi:MAG: hypothetical protein ACI8UO_006417 [Verrucomicrobiales bacterium]|jgi:hypothetical protein
MNDEQLQAAFQAQTIPLSDWDHRKHLRLAWIHLSQNTFDEALNKIRSGIQAYNKSVGMEEGPEKGFHETLTVAWMKMVDYSMREHGAKEDSEAFLAFQPQLCIKQLLRSFYTPKQMLSAKAKQEFVPPDILPLPISTK